jgi:hypothetical protein
MNTYDLFTSALSLPPNSLSYTISEGLANLFPDRAILEGNVCYCDIEEYAAAGLCTLEFDCRVHNQLGASWDEDDGIEKSARNVWYSVRWKDQILDCLILTWNSGWHDQRYLWIIADDEAGAEAFFSAVSAWNAEVRDEVLIFEGGYWQKSDTLFQAIRTATFENLVLAGSLGKDLRDDLSRFFTTKETYDRYNVPWKRGVLLVGPPGNGKTHAVKALVNQLRKPCLYVKSFQAEDSTEHDCIRHVFERARKTAPCILVLEDLDSLINDGNRSFFLNELDGFAANSGILTLATTNHPGKLDPAIVERPSRFDRKYHFELPGCAERSAYVRRWTDSLGEGLRPSEAGLVQAVESTEGFSFAYLEELFLSSMMGWMSSSGALTMDEVLKREADSLRRQMTTASTGRETSPQI